MDQSGIGHASLVQPQFFKPDQSLKMRQARVGYVRLAKV
jgi:hypothetical protein